MRSATPPRGQSVTLAVTTPTVVPARRRRRAFLTARAGLWLPATKPVALTLPRELRKAAPECGAKVSNRRRNNTKIRPAIMRQR
jgi:hypothetical protein